MSVSKTLRMSALAAVAATLAAPAFAGGFAEPIATPVVTPVVVPPAPVVQSGDWGGGYVGGQLSFGDLEFDVDGAPSADASYAGVFGGYRFDFGRFVAGGEISYNAGEIDDDFGNTLDSDLLRAGVQLGYDAGRILPYVTAGYANLGLEEGGVDVDFDGSYAGVGVDFAVSPRFTVGAEYLVHSFDAEDEFGADLDLNTFGVRAAYNF